MKTGSGEYLRRVGRKNMIEEKAKFFTIKINKRKLKIKENTKVAKLVHLQLSPKFNAIYFIIDLTKEKNLYIENRTLLKKTKNFTMLFEDIMC